jgi:hypothetical protein
MNTIYTKEGRPVRVSGNDLYSRTGKHVGRIRSGKAFGPDGKYIGTIVGDRLIYRDTHSATRSSPYAPRSSEGHAVANKAATAEWGEEPRIPD